MSLVVAQPSLLLPTLDNSASLLVSRQFDRNDLIHADAAVAQRVCEVLDGRIAKVGGTDDFLLFDAAQHRWVRVEKGRYNEYLTGALMDFVRELMLREAVNAEDQQGLTDEAKMLRSTASNLNTSRGRNSAASFLLGQVRVIEEEQLDARTDLIVCRNGVIDLGNGAVLRPGQPDDLMSRSMSASFDETIPTSIEGNAWARQLRASVKDDETAAALWRWAGWAMTGRPDKRLVMPHSTEPDTGKTSFLEGLVDCFGDYGHPLDTSVLEQRGKDSAEGHRTGLAEIAGARFVRMDELDKVGTWNMDATVFKRLTGGGGVTISARKASASSTDVFKLRATIGFGVQEIPGLRASQAIKRRILPIEFVGQFGKDASFDAEVWRAEHRDEMMSMLVKGYREVADADDRAAAYGFPDYVVREATQHWEAADPVRAFLNHYDLYVSADDDDFVVSDDLRYMWDTWPDREPNASYQHMLMAALKQMGAETGARVKVNGIKKAVVRGLRRIDDD